MSQGTGAKESGIKNEIDLRLEDKWDEARERVSNLRDEEDGMEELPYTNEQIEELKEWLNKPYDPGGVHIPDSVNLKRSNQLVEKMEISRLKLFKNGTY